MEETIRNAADDRIMSADEPAVQERAVIIAQCAVLQLSDEELL